MKGGSFGGSFVKHIYYQKIFYPNGELYGVELLFKGRPYFKVVDYYLLLRFIELAHFLPFPKVHINLSLESLLVFLEFVDTHLLAKEGDWDWKKVVFEVVETSSFTKEKVSLLEPYAKEGFVFALDDLGTKGVPLWAISYFPVVKVDIPSIPKACKFVEYLKEFPIFVIGERCFVKDLKVDAFQAYELHRPERLVLDNLKGN